MNEIWATRSWVRARWIIRGWKVRLAATIGLLVGGLVGIILYLAFLAERFAWYQSLAIILSTLLVIPTIVVAMWVLWGIHLRRHRWEWADGPFDL